MGKKSIAALRTYEKLYDEYSLLSELQVAGESVYAGRTGIITLAQGLLFAALGSLLQSDQPIGRMLEYVIPVVGIVLSALWYFFEQRNHVYYSARGSILGDIERRLAELAGEAKIEFQPFWTEVGARVRTRARWNQRLSAPLVLRTLVPVLFFFAWMVVLIGALTLPATPPDPPVTPSPSLSGSFTPSPSPTGGTPIPSSTP